VRGATVKGEAESEELLSAVPHAVTWRSFAVHGSLSHTTAPETERPMVATRRFRHGGVLTKLRSA